MTWSVKALPQRRCARASRAAGAATATAAYSRARAAMLRTEGSTLGWEVLMAKVQVMPRVMAHSRGACLMYALPGVWWGVRSQGGRGRGGGEVREGATGGEVLLLQTLQASDG